jgi:hypothetical protein
VLLKYLAVSIALAAADGLIFGPRSIVIFVGGLGAASVRVIVLLDDASGTVTSDRLA